MAGEEEPPIISTPFLIRVGFVCCYVFRRVCLGPALKTVHFLLVNDLHCPTKCGGGIMHLTHKLHEEALWNWIASNLHRLLRQKRCYADNENTPAFISDLRQPACPHPKDIQNSRTESKR